MNQGVPVDESNHAKRANGAAPSDEESLRQMYQVVLADLEERRRRAARALAGVRGVFDSDIRGPVSAGLAEARIGDQGARRRLYPAQFERPLISASNGPTTEAGPGPTGGHISAQSPKAATAKQEPSAVERADGLIAALQHEVGRQSCHRRQHRCHSCGDTFVRLCVPAASGPLIAFGLGVYLCGACHRMFIQMRTHPWWEARDKNRQG